MNDFETTEEDVYIIEYGSTQYRVHIARAEDYFDAVTYLLEVKPDGKRRYTRS